MKTFVRNQTSNPLAPAPHRTYTVRARLRRPPGWLRDHTAGQVLAGALLGVPLAAVTFRLVH